MSQSTIEGLSEIQARQRFLSAEIMHTQIEALQHMVGAAHDQLVTHQINRDQGVDLTPEMCRYDAFFRITNEEAVMRISSVGLPDEKSSNGLFVEIHTADDHQIVSLQTAKVPDMVHEEEALWLSGYTAEQLELLANIITTATPMDKNAYSLYRGLRRSPILSGNIDNLIL